MPADYFFARSLSRVSLSPLLFFLIGFFTKNIFDRFMVLFIYFYWIKPVIPIGGAGRENNCFYFFSLSLTKCHSIMRQQDLYSPETSCEGNHIFKRDKQTFFMLKFRTGHQWRLRVSFNS